MTPTSTTPDVDALCRPMPMRRLGRTDVELSVLTMGGVKWDSCLPEPDAVRLLHRAFDLGVTAVDSANIYASGESERRIGLALQGRREGVFLSTKTTQRDGGEARREIEGSLQRLQTDVVDLYYMHGIDNEEDVQRILTEGSVLDVLREFREAGHIRFLGASGHWYKDSMERLIGAIDLDVMLVPVGLFNQAYGYSFFDRVIPTARERGMGVVGMKVFGAGRVKHAAAIEPYLRYSLHRDVDSLAIGCDSIAQLEQTVGVIKRQPPALPEAEAAALETEARTITQSWDRGEYNWVQHYLPSGA